MTESSPRDRLPPRSLPLLYLGFAHLSLGTAFLLLGLWPRAVVGFFYQPRMLAVVHLVTLGWISGSILGAIYLIAPIALRMHIAAGGLDYAAFTLFAVGVTGMVGHFWIDSYRGMLWSAATTLAGIAWVTARVLLALRSAGLPAAIKAHVGLAFLNVLGAGLIGFLVGLEKLQVDVIPGFVLDNVYGHAHLAGLGWATMMVVGTGYRLFPMFLPAAMPSGWRVWLSVVLLEVGALGLLFGFMLQSRWTPAFALSAVGGLLAFFAQVAWMRRHPRPSPRGLRRPDYGMLHALLALVYLLLATALGLALALAPAGAWKIEAAVLYGVFGLVGFLAQMVVGMASRLLPMFAWMHAYAGSDYKVAPPSPHDMPQRGWQLVVLASWAVGVPLLAAGLYEAEPTWVSGAGWVLLLAVAVGAANGVRVVLHAFRGPPRGAADATSRPRQA